VIRRVPDGDEPAVVLHDAGKRGVSARTDLDDGDTGVRKGAVERAIVIVANDRVGDLRGHGAIHGVRRKCFADGDDLAVRLYRHRGGIVCAKVRDLAGASEADVQRAVAIEPHEMRERTADGTTDYDLAVRSQRDRARTGPECRAGESGVAKRAVERAVHLEAATADLAVSSEPMVPATRILPSGCSTIALNVSALTAVPVNEPSSEPSAS
jgi:hypothetical protein